MAKQVWTVRIIIRQTGLDRQHAGRDGWWLGEALRYAGISSHLATFEDPHREVYELRCPDPRGIDTKIWADQNAARLRSFGMDAAAAPRWSSEGLAYQQHYREQMRAERTGDSE